MGERKRNAVRRDRERRVREKDPSAVGLRMTPRGKTHLGVEPGKKRHRRKMTQEGEALRAV